MLFEYIPQDLVDNNKAALCFSWMPKLKLFKWLTESKRQSVSSVVMIMFDKNFIAVSFYKYDVSMKSPCHTRVASSRRLHGVQEKPTTPRCAQWDLLERRGIAVASPLDAVGSPTTPCHGAQFVHAQSARRGSAFPRRSEWAPCERSGFAAATQ